MIIADRSGHTTTSTGASDILNEVIENRIVLKRVNELLKEQGNVILSCQPSDSIGDGEWNVGVRMCRDYYNSRHVDMFFSIHFNAAMGAYGSEIVTSSRDVTIIPYANRILSNLESLGFRNRGVKRNDGLAETVGIDIPTMIIEVCFVHQKDAAIYRSVGVERIARAIANGIDSRVGLVKNNIKKEEEIKVKNIVVYGNDIDKRGAEYLADKLQCSIISKNIAYDYSRIENVYCIGGKQADFTGYCTKFIGGANRYETCQNVLNFIKAI